MTVQNPELSKPYQSNMPQSLSQHFGELRRRLLIVLITLCVITLGIFPFSEQLWDFFRIPLKNTHVQLINITPAEPLVLQCLIAISIGALFTLPLFFYQFWKFIQPAFSAKITFSPIKFLGLSFILGGLGASFAFGVLSPFLFQFLESIAPDQVLPQWSQSSYYHMILRMCLLFTFAFQTPIIFWFLSKTGIINGKALLGKWRPMLVICLLVSAFCTPPDVFSMLMAAAPLYTLFHVSALISRRVAPRPRVKAKGDSWI